MLADPDWFVSFSHAGPWSAVAVARAPVGLDIERRDRQLDWAAIADVQLPSSIRQRLGAAAREQRREQFLREWTRVEASAKLHGRGLVLPVDEADIATGCMSFITEALVGCVAVLPGLPDAAGTRRSHTHESLVGATG